MFKVRLHPLFDGDGDIGAGVDVVPAAEEQATPQVDPASQTGANEQAAAEPEKQNNFEKAFAKRLAAERDKWDKDTSEKYKDYEALKKTTSYFQQRHGYTDLMAMNADIELAELQARAEKENVPAEVLKRIDQLESEAAEGKQLKQQQQEIERVNTYFSSLNEFVKDKGVDAQALNQFMIDNELQYNPNAMDKSFTVALNAFKADEYKTKLETAKKDAIDEYLGTKRAPKTEGSTGAAGFQTADTSKMSWKDLTKHAAARLDAAKQPQ
jgi:hypothetical protein